MNINSPGFKRLAYSLEIIVLFAIQQTPGLLPQIGGERPVTMIPVLLTIAMFEGQKSGMFFGLAIGLLMDFGYGKVLGFNAIILMLFGYIVGSLAINLIKNNILTVMLMSVFMVILFFTLHFLFFYILRGYDNGLYAFVEHYVPRIFYTVVITPIIYFFNMAFTVKSSVEQE